MKDDFFCSPNPTFLDRLKVENYKPAKKGVYFGETMKKDWLDGTKKISKYAVIQLGFYMGLTAEGVNELLILSGNEMLYILNVVDAICWYYLDRFSKEPLNLNNKKSWKCQFYKRIYVVKEAIDGWIPNEEDGIRVEKESQAAKKAGCENPQIYGYTKPIGWTIDERIQKMKEHLDFSKNKTPINATDYLTRYYTQELCKCKDMDSFQDFLSNYNFSTLRYAYLNQSRKFATENKFLKYLYESPIKLSGEDTVKAVLGRVNCTSQDMLERFPEKFYCWNDYSTKKYRQLAKNKKIDLHARMVLLNMIWMNEDYRNDPRTSGSFAVEDNVGGRKVKVSKKDLSSAYIFSPYLSYATDVFAVTAIFYRMFFGKECGFDEEMTDMELQHTHNIPSILLHRIMTILQCGLEFDMAYRYHSVKELRKEIKLVRKCLMAYTNHDYYSLFHTAYSSWMAQNEIMAQTLECDVNAFHKSCEKLSADLVKNSIDVLRCEYIFHGLWKIKEYYGKDKGQINGQDIICLLSSGISIYNKLGNNEKTIELYEELKEYKAEIPILTYMNMVNRVAVSYADHYDYQTAYKMIKQNVKNLEALKHVYEKIAKQQGIPLEKTAMVGDLARAYSAMGCYMAQLRIGNPMEYFLKAIKEFGFQTGNVAITQSHILHYAVELGGQEGKYLYEQYAAEYFRDCDSLSEQYRYAKALLEMKDNPIEYPMWIYLKGLLAFYEPLKDTLEQIKIDFYEGVFDQSKIHPMPLILRTIGQIGYIVNGKQVDRFVKDAYCASLQCDSSAQIDENVPLSIVMVINYVTLYQYNEMLGKYKENEVLVKQLIRHAKKCGWVQLAKRLRRDKTLSGILTFEYY